MSSLKELGKTLQMVDNMEIIEKSIKGKGRFVGDITHIKISTLAKVLKQKNQRISELETFIESRGYDVPE